MTDTEIIDRLILALAKLIHANTDEIDDYPAITEACLEGKALLDELKVEQDWDEDFFGD